MHTELDKMLRQKYGTLLSEDFENKSFFEKWREHLALRKKSGSGIIVAKTMIRTLFAFQVPTQMYLFSQFIIPYVMADYGPWVIYYTKVLAWFILINGVTNWLCVILYDPSVDKSRDNPDLVRIDRNRWENPPDQFVPLIQEATRSQNGDVVYDMTQKEGLPWEYCNECQRHIPPRAHHCKICKTCILKRDHHCYIVGNCIGFKNQRYFIVLAFYAMLNGSLSAYFTYRYLKEVYWPTAVDWMDFLPPATVWRLMFGSMQLHIALMILTFFLELLFGFVGWVYFTSQMAISADGKTLYEVAKRVPIRNTNSVSRNFRSVFGDFWVLNFLFPMTVIFRQRDDGVHWEGVKILHVSDGKNKKWEEEEEEDI